MKGLVDYQQQQRKPTRHLTGIGIVIAFHVVLVWALINGLAQRVIEIAKRPLEVKIVQEVKPPPPEAPPPPPPQLDTPAMPTVPPPEVNIAAQPPQQNVMQVAAVPSPPQAKPAPQPQQASTAPVVQASSCREPEYPAASARAGESGRVVLALLVDVDGKVKDSKVEKSSGSPRLDEAARQALSLCKFTPATLNGKPELGWGRIAYDFKNPNDSLDGPSG
jgi:protein TonB